MRSAAEENRRRLEAALKEQRSLVRKLGEAERSLGGSAAARSAARKAAADQEFWSEEAGRRFAVQQEELVALREQTQALAQQLAAAVPAETAARYEGTIKELQQLVRFYEQRLTAAGAAAAAVGVDALSSSFAPAVGQDNEGYCGSWVLESLTEGGACYLWERSSGRVMTDVPDGHWPRPVGEQQGSAAFGRPGTLWGNACSGTSCPQSVHDCKLTIWLFGMVTRMQHKHTTLQPAACSHPRRCACMVPAYLQGPGAMLLTAPCSQASSPLPCLAYSLAAKADWIQLSRRWQRR